MRELVGQGKPFYSALDKAAGLLRRKVGTGSEFLKELMSIPGVKQAEIAERGLGELLNAPKMTHEQFMAALSAKPAPAIHEKVFGEKPALPSKEVLRRNANDLIRVRAREYASEGSDTSAEYRRLAAEEMQRLRSNHMDQALRLAEESAPKNPSPTYHYSYTLPGGDNYREMLIKAPKGGDQFQGVRGHFGGEEGILASMRLKDRTGPNGEKLLHLEELQSDWHQQGREKGYKGENNKIEYDDPVYENARQTATHYLNEFNRNNENPARQAEILPLLTQAQEVERTFTDYNNRVYKQVPDAPFKKNWEEMALKRLIHHAAENGYHGVVVTPGAEQADRYSLANHIDGLSYTKNSNGTVDLAATKNNSTVLDKSMQTPEQVESMVGKDVARKIFESSDNLGSLSGLDLKIGGEGMKAFYDKKVPNILNGIGKKYGVKTELGGHKLPGDPSLRGDASERLGLAGERLADMSPEQVQAFNQKLDDANAKQLHYFPITEAMRQDVKKNGIPLYKSGGIVSTH